MSSLNGADWVIVAILLVSVVIGLWRGFIREVLSLLVWVVAIAAAIMFGGDVALLFGDWVGVPSVRVMLGYVAVFLLVFTLFALLAWLLTRLLRSGGLSGTDRMLGLGFGLLRGGLLVAVLVLLLGYTPLPRDPWWQESQFIARFEPLAAWVREQLPDTLAALQALTPPEVPPPGGRPEPAGGRPDLPAATPAADAPVTVPPSEHRSAGGF